MFQFTKERKGKAYENPEIVRMSAKMNDNKSNKSDFASVWIFTPFHVVRHSFSNRCVCVWLYVFECSVMLMQVVA